MTPSLLTDEQIQTLRVEWLDDYIDLRPQWGTPVASTAAKGAQALALTGLASVGTLTSGTRFRLYHNGQVADYYLTADALITSGTATIKFGPPLLGAVINGAHVTPEPRQKSLYNKRTGRLFFEDFALYDLAARVSSLRGRFVRTADDPENALFRAVRYYGWTGMLASDEYLNAVLANDNGSNKLLVEQKMKILAEDAAIIFADRANPYNVSFVR